MLDKRGRIVYDISSQQVLTKSFEIKSLNEIAEYLYALTNKYNKFYMENKILVEENKDLQELTTQCDKQR